MKTAVSVPDAVFRRADRLARKLKKSRSELYSAALAEYVSRHDDDEVTERMNVICDAVDQVDEFVRVAARRALRRVEW